MEENTLKVLLDKYTSGQCTPEETAIIESWFLKQSMENSADFREADRLADMTEVRSALLTKIRHRALPVKRLWPRVTAAASIAIALSFGGYLLLHKQPVQQIADNRSDILPGSNQAMLTLANGQKIPLNRIKNGQVALQGNIAVTKTADGHIAYKTDQSAAATGKLIYNTMTTPRGGQYQVTLSDGTKVWLNAASSIKYPTAFNGKDREVQITGEAYFEVVHNRAKPFRVIANGQSIEDIGTHFNVNAYDDEPVLTTTLIEGSVKIVKGNHEVLLKPGQAAVTQKQLDDIIVKSADTEEAIAWKNGESLFNDEDIQTIMRQVSRWYDIDVVYEGQIPNRRFEGGISRKSNLSSFLKILELNNVHFAVIDHKIIIRP